MSNRRRQNIRITESEDATDAHSGSVDDTLAEEYQNIHPAGPDDIHMRRRGRGGRRRGNARTSSNAPRLAPREPCGKCKIRPRQGTAIVTCIQCNLLFHDKSSCTKGVLLDESGSFTCYTCNPAQQIQGRGRPASRPRAVSESFLDVPEHQSTLARSQAELLLQDIGVLEAGGDVSLTIEDLAGDEFENTVDPLDKVLEKLVKAGHPFERRDMEKDGNCWWSSIADQILLEGLEFPSSHEELRLMVINSADLHPNRVQWIQSIFNNDVSAWESWKRYQLRNGTFTDEWGLVQHLTAFYLDVNIHIIGTSNTDSNPYTAIASTNHLDTVLWVGYTQDYEGLKDGHYDSLRPLGDASMNGYTSLRLESGTAEISADSVVLDSDFGLYSDGSVSADDVFDELGETETNAVEADDILVDEVEAMDTNGEPAEVEPDLPSGPKDIVCKKGKGICISKFPMFNFYILREMQPCYQLQLWKALPEQSLRKVQN